MRIHVAAALCVAALMARGSYAQEAAQPAPPPAPACCQVAAGTPIELEIRDALDSKQSQRGDKFVIALHAPLVLGTQVVIPAGTQGVGEVVHAERARGGGKPGELILAARYLDFEGRRVPLRGMKLGVVGEDNSGKAMGLAMIPVAGLFIYVRGGETVVPQGALAIAKIAEAFDANTPSAPAPQLTESASLPVQDAAVVPSSNNAVSKE
jgi:hypothetical protein